MSSRHRLGLLAFHGIALIPSVAFAYDGPLDPPDLVEGKHVYAIPEGYLPKEATRTKVEELEETLSSLRQDFYVFFVEELPPLSADQRSWATANGFRGDDNTLRAEVAYAMLALDLQVESDGRFDAAQDSGFLLAASPRKYAWAPGSSYWGAPANVSRGRAQDRFSEFFIRRAKAQPSDPAGGIAALARELDQHVFEATDPAQIAARAEREQQAEAARRLKVAQSELDAQILHLSDLLADTDYLPEDVVSYQDTLAHARQVRRANDPAAMMAEAAQMKATVQVLEDYVNERHAEASAALVANILLFLLISGIVGGILWVFFRRLNEVTELRTAFNEALLDWEEKVANAHHRWTSHYLERDDIIGLDKVTGRTRELWDQTTQAVDSILHRIKAMQKHLKECRDLAAQGGFWNLDNLRQARTKLDDPFAFDTGVINEADLFGAETVVINVQPAAFAKETNALFVASIEGWKKLKEAAQLKVRDSMALFPHDTMDQLLKDMADYEIPLQWATPHPLAGDEESDRLFYSSLDSLRQKDPLAYYEEIKKARDIEREVVARVKLVCEALDSVKKVQTGLVLDVPIASDLTGGDGGPKTRVEPEDDPSATLGDARKSESKLLAEAFAGTDPATVQKLAAETIALYEKANRQAAEIRTAINSASGRLESVKGKGRGAVERLAASNVTLKDALGKFSKAENLKEVLAQGQKLVLRGNLLVDGAETALAASEHLNAHRIADQAAISYKSAVAKADEIDRQCATLEKERASYESLRSQIETKRGHVASRMKGFGTYAKPVPAVRYASAMGKGAVDYGRLHADLVAQETAWQAALRTAEYEYEEDRRRIRRAQEEAERRRREEEGEDRRRRSSYASTYSSSSSSTSGFGGSSGGSGGGGFGGSSGDW